MSSKFRGSASNDAVKDLIRRFVSDDGAGKDGTVTFQEAVGAALAGSMASDSASSSVDDGSEPDASELITSEKFHDM